MTVAIDRALLGTSTAPELVFRRVYRAEPGEVRSACTDITRLGRWFGTVEGNPAGVGDSFTAMLSDDPDDKAVGTVLTCADNGYIVSWSWQCERESTIEVRITEIEAGHTELTVHHRLTEPEHAAGYGGGWEQMLQVLDRHFTGEPAVAGSDEQVEADAVQTWRTMSSEVLEVEQRVEASAAQVWAALATAEGLRTWWWRHWDDVTIEADPVIGGSYRIEAPEAGIVLDGSYLVLDEPTRIAFTWRWQDADGSSTDEAVDITLEEVPADEMSVGHTMIRVRHSGPWADSAPAASYADGWHFTLGELAKVLAEQADEAS